MTAKTVKAKGRVASTAGASTRTRRLKHRGALEQATRAFKEAVDGIVESVKGVVAGSAPKPRRRRRRAHV